MAEPRALRLPELSTGSAYTLAAMMVCATLLWSVAKPRPQALSSLNGQAFYALVHASGVDATTPAPASSAPVPTATEIGAWLGSAVLTVACHNH